ncbi:M-protein, striated muscle-like [Amphiura filiformis]|uniref:M-protein, striated muscle-like n=1 Tax=Amphiura filiformis TaxID=82378 RepID=UPI003B21B50F
MKTDGAHQFLIMPKTELEDDAQYTIKVSEDQTSTCHLTVEAGTKIKVDATITGSPAPTVTVAQDTTELKPSARVTIATEKGTKAKMTLTIDKCGGMTWENKPKPPTNLRITQITPETVTLVWEPPTDDGGSPITKYIIEKRDTKRPTWTNAGTSTSSQTEFTVTKLFTGNEYLFRVSAVNKHGQSEPVETSEPIIVKHQFEFDARQPDHRYILEKRDTTTEKWIRVNKEPMKELTCTCTDLTEGSEYEFRVMAENKAGQSKPSDVSDKFVAKPPYDVPGPPGKPEPENINKTTIKITWTPPETDGGSPVTGYIIERCDVSRKRWVRVNREKVTETDYTVTELIEGTEYQFRVSAENLAGVGKPSEPSVTVTAKLPYDAPGKPKKPDVYDVDATEMTVSWSPPESDGGSPITGYILEKKEKSSKRWITASKEPLLDTTFKVRELIQEEKYEFRVAAVNNAGQGPFSEPSDAVLAKPPYETPGAPDKPTVSDIDATQMTVT